MDEEIKNLIDVYTKQIEERGDNLLLFRSKIDVILINSSNEFEQLQVGLDKKFEDENLSEEKYLTLFREGKENILKQTKEKLDTLVANLK